MVEKKKKEGEEKDTESCFSTDEEEEEEEEEFNGEAGAGVGAGVGAGASKTEKTEDDENKNSNNNSSSPAFLYFFKRPIGFQKLILPFKAEIQKKQEEIIKWEESVAEMKEMNHLLNEQREKEEGMETEEETTEEETTEEETTEEEELPMPIHAVINGYNIMKKYFLTHSYEFGYMNDTQMEKLYMIMDVITIPIGGTIIKVNETMSFLGILFHGELYHTILPEEGDLLGKEKVSILPTGTILGDEELFQYRCRKTPPPAVVDMKNDEEEKKKNIATSSNGKEEKEENEKKEKKEEEEKTLEKGQGKKLEVDEDEIEILRTATIVVKETSLLNMNTTDSSVTTTKQQGGATMGLIRLQQLKQHPDLMSLLVRGCGVRVVDKYRKMMQPRPKSPKKSKSSGKSSKKNKNKNKNGSRPGSPKKEHKLLVCEEDYNDVDEEEIVYRVWVDRARRGVMNEDDEYEKRKREGATRGDGPIDNEGAGGLDGGGRRNGGRNGELPKDPIEIKYYKRAKKEQEKRERVEWERVVMARELIILRKFKAASVALMNGVKKSFTPLSSVIKKARRVHSIVKNLEASRNKKKISDHHIKEGEFVEEKDNEKEKDKEIY